MKKKLIIFIILFCVLLAGGGVGIYFVNAANEAVVSFDESDAKYATTLKETPTNGTKPDDYDSLTNIYYALYNLEHKEAFSCITTGEAKASVATQAISNSRIVIGDEALVSTISDGIIKTGTQKYFVNKGEKVLLRTHQSISDCKAIWKTDTPECITTDAYILRYGWLPFKAIGYIICDDTVLEASPLKYENGAYEITLNLDPNGDKAPFWYRREVATNGSSTMVPEFSLINLTYRFDENWNVLSVHAQEKYLVKSMGIKTTCETNCYDTYTYDNVSFDKDSYDFFQQYKDLSAKEGRDDVKVDALTMLTSSLANEETGENLGLSIKFNDKLVEGLCSIDITDLNNLKVKVLAKDLYVEYSDYLYISLGNLKLKSDTESLKALLDEFNGTIPNVEAIDTAGILAAFDNAKIEEIDNETVVNVTFNLLGYDINLEYSTYKDDVDYILNYVKVNALVEGNLVEINARPSTNIFPQIDKRSFSDLSNLDYLFSFFSKLIVDKKVEANFDINYDDIKANLALKAVFEDTISLKLDFDLKYKNKSFLIDITYIDDVIYLSYDDIHLMISKDDLVSLINKYTNNSLEGGINVTELIEKVMEFDFSNLIKETQITDSSFYLKTNLEDLIGLKDDILLTLKEGEDINLELILNKLNLVGNIKTNKDLNITLEEENYSNIYNLKPVIDELLSLINNKKISLSLNLNYQGIDIFADAKIDFNDLENIKAKAQINLTKDNNNLEIELTYLNDILYIDFANNKLSINKDSIILLLNKFNISFDSNENIIDQLLSIDFEQMIKDFTILENEIYINLDLSMLKESLNDIKASIKKTNDGLNINVNLFDLDIFVKSFDEEINIIGEYQSLDNLLSLVDNIKTIIENKKIALDLNLSYEDINISANAIVDFNDINNLKINALVNLTKNDNNISLEITYLDNNLYIDAFGQKISIKKETILKLLDKFGINLNSNNINIIDTIMSLDFDKIIDDIKAYENKLEIGLNLSDFFEALSDLNILIENNDEAINLLLNKFNLKATLKATDSNIEISGNYQSLDNLDLLIDNIKSIIDNKKIELNVNACIKDILIEGDVKLDFNDLNSIKAEAIINLIKGELKQSIKLTYLNDIIYLDFAGQKLSIEKDTLLNILAKFGINLNLDSNINIIDELFKLDFNAFINELTIGDNNLIIGLDLSSLIDEFKDLIISISEIENEIEINLNKYDINAKLKASNFEIEIGDTYQSLDSLDDFIDIIKSIIDNKKLELELSANIKDIDVLANVKLDFNDLNPIKAEALINLVKGDLKQSIKLTYIEDVIYLDFAGQKLSIEKDTLLNILAKFDINLNMDSNLNIIDEILKLDFDKLLKELIINDDSLSLGLDLSQFLDSLNDIETTISANNGLLELTLNKFDLNANLKVSDFEIEVDGIYQELDSLEGLVDIIKSIIDNKKLELDLTANIKDIDILANVKLDFNDLNSIKAEAIIDLVKGDLKQSIKLTYLSDVIYLDFAGQKLSIEKDTLLNILAKFDINLDLDSNINIIDEILKLDFSKLLNKLVINDNSLSIGLDLSQFLDSLNDIETTISANNGLLELALNKFDLCAKVEVEDFDIKLDGEYKKLDNLEAFVDIIRSIINNKKIELDLSANIKDIDILANVKLDFNDLNSIKAEAIINLVKGDLKQSLKLIYLNDVIYLDFAGQKLSIEKDTLLNILSKFDINLNLDSNINIIDEILKLDFDKLLKELIINEDSLSLGLDLSQFLDSLNDVNLNINKDADGLNISCNMYNIYGRIVPNDFYISLNGEYKSLDNLEGLIDIIKSIIDNKNIVLDLSANIKDIDVLANVKLDFTDSNSIKAEALINLVKGDLKQSLKLTYIEDVIYLDFAGQKLSIEKDTLLNILAKFDINLNLDSNINIIDEVLKLDFEKILNKLVIEENDLMIGLDLSQLLVSLNDLEASITANNGLLELALNKFDLCAKVEVEDFDIKLDGEYKKLDNLEAFVDNIKAIIDNKALSITFNARIKEIEIEGNLLLDFNDLNSIKALANINLSKESLTQELKVTYLNDILYIDFAGHKLSIEKDTLLKVLAKFDINLDLDSNINIIDELLKLDFEKIISKLDVNENSLLLGLDLSILLKDLNNLEATITNNIDSFDLALNKFDLLMNVKPEKVDITLDGEYKALDDLSMFIDNIKSIIDNKKIEVELSANIKEIAISTILDIDFTDINSLKAKAIINLSNGNSKQTLNLTYLDDVIYLDFAGQKLSLNKDTLLSILSKFDINLDNNINIIDELFKLDFSKLLNKLVLEDNSLLIGLDLSNFLDSLKYLEAKISNNDNSIELDLNKLDLNASISVKEFEVEVEGSYKEIDQIDSFIDSIKDIIDNKKLKLDIIAKYKDIDIKGYALIDFNENIKVYASLNILYKENIIPVEVHFIDNLIYLDYKDIHGFISLDKLIDIFDINLMDPIDLLFSIKYETLIEDINVFEDINLTINLDYLLNDILGIDLNLGNVNAKISNNNSVLNVTSDIIDELNIDINSNFDDEIKLKDISYINLDSILSNAFDIFKIINKKSFRLEIDADLNISNFVSLLSKDITVNGYVDFLYDDGYKINANLSIQYDKIIANINIKYQDKYLYIEALGIDIKLSVDELDSLIKEVMVKFEIDDSNLDISKDDMLNKAFEVIETALLINENTISIDLNKLIDKLSILTIILLNNNGDYSLNLNMDILNCDILLDEIENYDLVYSNEYLEYNDILNLCDMVAEIINISKNKEFNLNLDFSVYDQGNKHLDVFGNLQFKIYENGKFDLHASGTITQYENQVTKYHIVDLYLISKEYYGTDTAKDMVYITYGTIPNSSSKIKVYLPLSEVLDVAGTVSKLLGVDLSFLDKYSSFNFNEIDTTQVSNLIKDDILGKAINLDKIINSFKAEEGRIELGLILNELLPQPDDNIVSLVVDTNDNGNVIASLSLNNLYTVYHSISENTMFDINNISLVNDAVNITVPNTNGYYNLTEIEKLVNGLITTATFKDFEIQGEAKLNMIGLDLISLPIDIKINVAEDGKPIIHAYIDASSPIAKTAFGTRYLDIYYKDEYVYIKKIERKGLMFFEKNGDTYYLKVKQQTFLDDLVYYLLEFGLGAKDIVMNNVNKTDENDNHVIDAGNVLNSYSHSGNNFNLGLNLEELTGNSMLGDASFTLGLSNVITNNETKEKNLALTSLKNLQVSLLGFINLTMDSLSISNIDSNGNVKAVDNSDLDTFIANYNKTRKTDVIYKNNSVDKTISHKITFVKGIAGENVIITGKATEEIIFPTINSFEYNGEVYNFAGWYMDKDLTIECSLTQFDDDNHKLYAKYVKA